MCDYVRSFLALFTKQSKPPCKFRYIKARYSGSSSSCTQLLLLPSRACCKPPQIPSSPRISPLSAVMGLAKNEGFLLIFMAFSGFTMGATVYQVGESAGWSVAGNVDYGKWASSKTFQVNDTLLFKFDPQYHNVLQVSRSDFHSCDATAPIATYSTGNDSFFIRSSGHYFFFCGFLGHCQAGQKVDIRVPKSVGPVGVPAGSPIQPPQASPDGPVVPSPSSGKYIICSNKIWLLLAFLMWDLF